MKSKHQAEFSNLSSSNSASTLNADSQLWTQEVRFNDDTKEKKIVLKIDDSSIEITVKGDDICSISFSDNDIYNEALILDWSKVNSDPYSCYGYFIDGSTSKSMFAARSLFGKNEYIKALYATPHKIPVDYDPFYALYDFCSVIIRGLVRGGYDPQLFFDTMLNEIGLQHFRLRMNFIPFIKFHSLNTPLITVINEQLGQILSIVKDRPLMPATERNTKPVVNHESMDALKSIRHDMDLEMRKLDRNKERLEWDDQSLSRDIFYMFLQSDVTSQKQIGNCGELSILTAIRLSLAGIDNVTVYEIPGLHTFLIAGDKICDPWLGKVYDMNHFQDYIKELAIGLDMSEYRMMESSVVARQALSNDAVFRATAKFYKKKYPNSRLVDEFLRYSPEANEQCSPIACSSSTSSAPIFSVEVPAGTELSSLDYLKMIKDLLVQNYAESGVGFFGRGIMPDYIKKMIDPSAGIEKIATLARDAINNPNRRRTSEVSETYQILARLQEESPFSVYKLLQAHTSKQETPRISPKTP